MKRLLVAADIEAKFFSRTAACFMSRPQKAKAAALEPLVSKPPSANAMTGRDYIIFATKSFSRNVIPTVTPKLTPNT